MAGPNVVLIVADTIRADRVSCYGYDRPTTPHMDELAGQGVLFENAYSQATFSGPSYASIFTGTYPHTHGVRDHPQVLEDRNVTLAEVFEEAGYRTAGFHTNSMVDERWNYHQGFDVYKYFPGQNDAAVVQGTKEWLSENGANGPFFLWVCLLAPHFPYVPPESFARRFAQPFGYQSEFLADYRNFTARKQMSWMELVLRYEELGYTEEDAAYNRSLYDAEIAYADSHVGELIQTLEKLKLAGNRTVLVVTSDHGESLGEHGLYFSHGMHLSDPQVHVPLLVRAPGRVPAGQRVSQVVRSIDIFPTVLRLAGIDVPDTAEGVDLAPAIRGEALEAAAFSENRLYVPELDPIPARYHRLYVRGVRGKWKSVRKENYFLTAIPRPEFTEYELYDVREVWKDSFRAPNRVHQLPEVFESLRQELLRWDAEDAKAEVPLERDEEAMEMLRSLGYL
ncbi:MAG: sulfatase [Acidobacteriota bacterium]|nr:MAG: sulfatase [Acidobacteriota bacterium]